jgi:hypothetical protein
MMAKTRDEYLTRDRSISVDTCKNTGEVTASVTLFSPIADRVFDRLSDEERTAWAEEFLTEVMDHFFKTTHFYATAIEALYYLQTA